MLIVPTLPESPTTCTTLDDLKSVQSALDRIRDHIDRNLPVTETLIDTVEVAARLYFDLVDLQDMWIHKLSYDTRDEFEVDAKNVSAVVRDITGALEEASSAMSSVISLQLTRRPKVEYTCGRYYGGMGDTQLYMYQSWLLAISDNLLGLLAYKSHQFTENYGHYAQPNYWITDYDRWNQGLDNYDDEEYDYVLSVVAR